MAQTKIIAEAESSHSLAFDDNESMREVKVGRTWSQSGWLPSVKGNNRSQASQPPHRHGNNLHAQSTSHIEFIERVNTNNNDSAAAMLHACIDTPSARTRTQRP